MVRGLTTAAAGMLADERMQQLLANNLANAQTPGFKASDGSMLEFPQQLLQRMMYGQNGGGQTIGSIGTGVVMQEGVPLFSEGTLTSTGRNLDVAIVDNTPPGTYAAVAGAAGQPPVSATGIISATGPGGRLEIGGQPLAVLNASGQVTPGVYVARNPAFTGTGLYAADGSANYDAAGRPSYLFVNAAGQPIGSPAESAWTGYSPRIGTQTDMGLHSFYAVQYQSPYSPTGIALTRDGSLNVTASHVLVDSAGNAILPVGANGKPINGARIVLNASYQGTDVFAPSGAPLIDAAGQPSYRIVGASGQPLAGARFGTVDADISQVSPLGGTEYEIGQSLSPTQALSLIQPGTGTLEPGKLEQSNVNTTATVAQMLAIVNQYQANQQVIQTEAQMMTSAASDVGKVNA